MNFYSSAARSHPSLGSTGQRGAARAYGCFAHTLLGKLEVGAKPLSRIVKADDDRLEPLLELNATAYRYRGDTLVAAPRLALRRALGERASIARRG